MTMAIRNPSGKKSSSLLSALFSTQDWDKLRILLSTGIGHVCAVQQEMLTSDDYASESALSYACRFHPPLDIVQAIMSLLPPDVARKSCDATRRSPLHIAAMSGAAPDVIRFLAEADSASAASQDATGKTPLHLVCQFYASNYSSDSKPLDEAVLEVVRCLRKVSPATVNFEDNEETTALEYAIESDLHIKVVKSLQRACERDWRNRRSAGEARQRHDDARQNMLMQQQQVRCKNIDLSQPMDISDISEALTALDKSAHESKKVDSPTRKISIRLSKPRKNIAPHALVA